MFETSINGQRYRFNEGISVLDACRSTGIDIPTLCHDERLKPIGSCRMCLVELDGKSRPVPSCDTLLTGDMVISTHTPTLENERLILTFTWTCRSALSVTAVYESARKFKASLSGRS